MNFQYIKDYYKVPAEMYREVEVGGKRGVIAEDMGHYIGVVFYENKSRRAQPCHPTSEVRYLDTFNYNPPQPTASQRRYVEYLKDDTDMPFGQWLKSYRTK